MEHFAVLKNSKRARARRVLFLFLGSAIAAWAGDPVLGIVRQVVEEFRALI